MKLICLFVGVLLLAPLLPQDLDAQRRGGRGGGRDFSMEPYAGVWFDPVVQGGRQAEPVVGLRIGYQVSPRVWVLADGGYSEVNGAGLVSSDQDAATRFTYGDDWVFTLAGVELVVVPGTSSGALTLLGGVGWRRTEIERRAVGGAPPPDVDGWGTYGILAPGVAFRHQLGPRGAVRFSLQDLIVDVDEDPDHAPVLTLGVSFR